MSTGSCLQHHIQENIWVLAVLAGNPDDACTKINDLLLTTENLKKKGKKKKESHLNQKCEIMQRNTSRGNTKIKPPQENSENKWSEVLLVFYDTKEFRIYV